MASCMTCGAEGVAPGQPCERCGDDGKGSHAGAPLELAVDPLAARAPVGTAPPAGGRLANAQAVAFREDPSPWPSQPPGGLDVDARLLADYGEIPKYAIVTPLYAFRVLRRRRELRAALSVRTAEAEHAQATLEEALVSVADDARPFVDQKSAYAEPLAALAHAEERLRARDEVLAAELDGQRGRLAQVDARIRRCEAELANAQGHERAVATELSGAQGALAREDTRIKRAETELRTTQQREAPSDRVGSR